MNKVAHEKSNKSTDTNGKAHTNGAATAVPDYVSNPTDEHQEIISALLEAADARAGFSSVHDDSVLNNPGDRLRYLFGDIHGEPVLCATQMLADELFDLATAGKHLTCTENAFGDKLLRLSRLAEIIRQIQADRMDGVINAALHMVVKGGASRLVGASSSPHDILVQMNRLAAELEGHIGDYNGRTLKQNIVEVLDTAIGDAHEAIGDVPDGDGHWLAAGTVAP